MPGSISKTGPGLPSALGGGDEQFRLAVDLVTAGMVFADPRLRVIVRVELLHKLEVALHAQQRVFVIGMKRRQEDPGVRYVLIVLLL